MKFAARLLLVAMFWGALMSPCLKMEGYGYQPDSEGYAYIESGYSVSASPLIPLAAVGAAVIIGALLYSGTHHHHHHGH